MPELLSSQEDEIRAHHHLRCVPGVVGPWLPARDRLSSVLTLLRTSQGLKYVRAPGRRVREYRAQV